MSLPLLGLFDVHTHSGCVPALGRSISGSLCHLQQVAGPLLAGWSYAASRMGSRTFWIMKQRLGESAPPSMVELASEDTLCLYAVSGLDPLFQSMPWETSCRTVLVSTVIREKTLVPCFSKPVVYIVALFWSLYFFALDICWVVAVLTCLLNSKS